MSSGLTSAFLAFSRYFLWGLRLTSSIRVDWQIDHLVPDIKRQQIVVTRKHVDGPDIFVQQGSGPGWRGSIDRSVERKGNVESVGEMYVVRIKLVWERTDRGAGLTRRKSQHR
jgi:hypothetical protein